jgi:hypothetical protein
MTNLIGMTDFVLKQFDRLYAAKFRQEEYVARTKKYANFLKQPLKLWMFLPCDESENVLNKSTMSKNTCEDDCNHKGCVAEMNECIKYQQAKERCLFEGFEIKYYPEDEFDNIESVLKFENCYVGIKYKDKDKLTLNDICSESTIELLVSSGPRLSPAALKIIGLT